MRHRLIIEYDGTKFLGWQWQPAGRTVQGELEGAIERVTGRHVRPLGAGRTDAGVHALGQSAHLDLETRLRGIELARALNACLPPDLCVREVQRVPPEFHARRDAERKDYVYEILNRPERSPLLRRRSWHVPGPLELAAMQAAAALMRGEHDFSAFRGARGGAEPHVDPRRTLEQLEVAREGDRIVIRAGARSFLRHMVRNLVGTLVEVGLGRREPASMAGLLEGGDRARAGPTAPARGLCLHAVRYPASALTPQADSAT